ncbi:MAG: hypothetical protein HYR85_11185 [Planctomycetes bacterium]|nr:hypothetical protein [Planctomycetota bacterium]MBI3846988.1 hypothetical protein [Planctomycetota bacterium]
MNPNDRVRLLSWIRYGGLVLIGAWVATIALFPRSDTARFLLSPAGKAVAFVAVGINLTAIVGLYVMKSRRR